jgi:hypothetical protein
MNKTRRRADPPVDTQVIELIGRNRLGSELLRDGLEVAVPSRDRGIDLIAFLDRPTSTEAFIACPIQMKAASKRSFGVFSKYAKTANLVIAYIWFVDNAEKAEMYALTYSESVGIATKMGWTKTPSWKKGGYSTNSPSEKLCELLRPYRMHRGDWKKKVLGSIRVDP